MATFAKIKKYLTGAKGRTHIQLPEPEDQSSERSYLYIATVIRNESEYIAEWLAFYKSLGVDKVILYDNGSDGALASTIESEVGYGFLEIVPWPNFTKDIKFQHLAFAHAMAYCAGRTKWLAILDIDEFMFPTVGDSLPAALKNFEDVPSLSVFWKNFGTSGHVAKPTGLVIENYTRRARNNDQLRLRNIKSVVQPAMIRQIIGAHQFSTGTSAAHSVDELRRPLEKKGNTLANESHAFQLNHYYSRSRSEFEHRITHGWGRKSATLVEERRANLQRMEADELDDTAILRFVDGVKDVMASWRREAASRKTSASRRQGEMSF